MYTFFVELLRADTLKYLHRALVASPAKKREQAVLRQKLPI
jgi:hypothetical protein